jgi:hypothetical protein
LLIKIVEERALAQQCSGRRRDDHGYFFPGVKRLFDGSGRFKADGGDET